MDQDNAIELRNVSKSFRVEVEDLVKKTKIFNRTPTKMVEHKVIDDLTLNVRKGDVLGIIGGNGAGKSTLLSLIARIMEPDSGTIARNGKIATILELGMGFHPDLSGRENIYLKGELYGFSRSEIDKKIEGIIDYSGIRNYIDNPVRTYSSGMSGRLAFAIMVNVESDIMLVDEILSVGDSAFSYKAREHFKKMAQSKKTVIIVSHHLELLESLCSRVIWLESGKILKDGTADYVCAEYRKYMEEDPNLIQDLATIGNAHYQYKFALMYKNGMCVHKDDQQFLYWLNQAVIQGYVPAILEYADYLYGIDKKEEALSYYNIASTKGDGTSRNRISRLNVPASYKDLIIDYYERNNPNLNGVQLYHYASVILKNAMGDDEKRKAFDLFIKSVDKDNADSAYQVALMYQNGIGVAKNEFEAIRYLKMAAKAKHIAALMLLSSYYDVGRYVKKDPKKAFELMSSAAEMGNPQAIFNVAKMYQDGIGTNQNMDLAQQFYVKYHECQLSYYYSLIVSEGNSVPVETKIQLFKKLAQFNNTNALANLINVYASGQITDGSIRDEAISGLESLAGTGNLYAIRTLGSIYHEGRGVPADPSKAEFWYKKGESMGDGICRNSLGDLYRAAGRTDDAVKLYREAGKQGIFSALNTLYSLCASGQITDGSIRDEAISGLESLAGTGNLYAIGILKKIQNDK